MSNKRFFKHGELKAFVNDSANWNKPHVFAVDALMSVKRVAYMQGMKCTAKYSGCDDTRTLVFWPKEKGRSAPVESRPAQIPVPSDEATGSSLIKDA